MKCWLCVVLWFVFLPVAVGGSCTEKTMHLKKEKILFFLTQAVSGQGKQTEFVNKGLPISQNFSTLYAQYQGNKEKGQPYLDQMCGILDQMIALANDLLAGGDGSGKKSPWKIHTPDDLFELEERILETGCCEETLNETRQRLFQNALDGDDPVDLVGNGYQELSRHLPQKMSDKAVMDGKRITERDIEEAALH